MFRAWWELMLVQRLALCLLHNSFGGCLSSLGLGAMSRSLEWMSSDGRYGKRITKLVSIKKFLKNHVDIIFQSVACMKYWACLHSVADVVQLQQGADALLNLALGPEARRNDADTSGVCRLTKRSEGDMEIDGDNEDTQDLA
jgi:hypothetical protein